MKEPAKMSRTQKLAEAALMVSLSFVLSLIPPLTLPFGGSITFFSTLPIIVMSLRHNVKWGVGTALAYSLTQIILGTGNFSYLTTIGAVVLCALLDYVLAYACIGLTGSIARKIGHGRVGLISGILISGLLRYSCSVVSGVIIWAFLTPEGTSVLGHSLKYNALWCAPDVAIVLLAALALSSVSVLELVPRKSEATA